MFSIYHKRYHSLHLPVMVPPLQVEGQIYYTGCTPVCIHQSWSHPSRQKDRYITQGVPLSASTSHGPTPPGRRIDILHRVYPCLRPPVMVPPLQVEGQIYHTGCTPVCIHQSWSYPSRQKDRYITQGVPLSVSTSHGPTPPGRRINIIYNTGCKNIPNIQQQQKLLIHI